jgi:hypothetical protein
VPGDGLTDSVALDPGQIEALLIASVLEIGLHETIAVPKKLRGTSVVTLL